MPRITIILRGSRLTPERLKALNIRTWLQEDEKDMFEELMINCKGAIMFNWKEVSKIYKDVSPLIIIKTIKHKVWQEKNFLCLRALILIIIKILQKCLE